MKIEKMLRISREHLSEESDAVLDKEPEKNRYGLTVYATPYGYRMYLEGLSLENGRICCGRNALEGLPADLAEGIRLALENECQWLEYDDEAQRVPKMKVYM